MAVRFLLPAALVLTSLLSAPPAAADDPPLAPGETIRDRGYAAMVVDGDTIRFGCASKNRYYEFRVTSRSVDVNDGTALLGGSAVEV